jgi:hypothetical protein
VEDMRRWLENFIRKNLARVSAWAAQRHGDIETTIEDYTYAVSASREGGQWIASVQRFAAGIDLETDASAIQEKLQSKFETMASAPEPSSTSTQSPSKAKSSPTAAKSQPKKQKSIPKPEQAQIEPLEVVGKKMTIHQLTRIHSIPDSEYYSSRGELRKYRVYVEPGHTSGHQCDGCLKVFKAGSTLRYHLESRARYGGVCPKTYDFRNSLLAEGPRADDLWERRKDDHSDFKPGYVLGNRKSSRIKDSNANVPMFRQPEVVTSAPVEVASADPVTLTHGLELDCHFADDPQGMLQGDDEIEFLDPAAAGFQVNGKFGEWLRTEPNVPTGDGELFDFDRSVMTDASSAMRAAPRVSNGAAPREFDYTDPIQSADIAITEDLVPGYFDEEDLKLLQELPEGDRPDVHTAPPQNSMSVPAEAFVQSTEPQRGLSTLKIPAPKPFPNPPVAVRVGDTIQITRPPSEFGTPTAVTDGQVISADMLNRVNVQPLPQVGCTPIASKPTKRPRKYSKRGIIWKTMAEMEQEEKVKAKMKHQAARSLVTAPNQTDQPVSLKQPAPQPKVEAQKLEPEIHQCSICQEFFSSALKLRNHIKGFTSVDDRMVCPNFCHHCGLTFVNSSTKSAHDKAHRDKGRCPIPVLSSVIATDRPLWTHHYTADNFERSRTRGRCTSAGTAYSDPLDVADAVISINALESASKINL